MKVLSLFDGMSCGQIALDKLGITFDGVKNKYYASEIKKHAIAVTKHNYPNTIHIGDVTKVKGSDLDKIDLLIGGSPCQDFSRMGKERLGLKGDRSGLFFEYLRLLKETKPKYFLLENVVMNEKDNHFISGCLGVYPLFINSALVSAQNRERYYWTNIKGNAGLFGDMIPEPDDKNIKLQDIIEKGYVYKDKHTCITTSTIRSGGKECREKRLTTTGMITLIFDSPDFDLQKGHRTVNITEMEKLQTIPAGYTKILSKNQASDVLGDGWTVDVIAHILSYANFEVSNETR